MSSKIAVIQFPGSNCEYETQRALNHFGLSATIVRWNTPPASLAEFAGFVLPGGFSYQDRVRAGAIAAKLPIIDQIILAAQAGKPVLGICNGCQILAETGLIPDLTNEQQIEIALAHNTHKQQPMGFICDWVYVRFKNPTRNLFTRYFTAEEIVPIPINHGEGRFMLSPGVEKKITELAQLQYCTSTGEIISAANPNGSTNDLAGLSNEKGNVLAMMPHPERAAFLKQIPLWLGDSWSELKKNSSDENPTGPWEKLFTALAEHLK